MDFLFSEGRQVGRVPANLCKAFRELQSRRLIEEVTCTFTGEVRESQNPHIFQRFRRNTNGHDTAGGGAELGCDYLVHIKPQNFENAMHVFEGLVPMNELDRRIFA